LGLDVSIDIKVIMDLESGFEIAYFQLCHKSRM